MPAAKTMRKQAPIGVSDVHRDYRAETLKELDDANPEYVHMYENPDTINRNQDLKTGRKEVVKDPITGEVSNHMGDPIVRMSREAFEQDRQLECLRSEAVIRDAVRVESPTIHRSPKKQRE